MKMQRGSIFRPEHDYYKIAGIIMMIGCFQFILAVNLAETMFPGFSIAKNTFSGLGSSVPIIGPSAIIFNLSIIILGILFLIAVYLILKSGGCRLFSSCLAISSIFAIGVGIFNAIHWKCSNTLYFNLPLWKFSCTFQLSVRT